LIPTRIVVAMIALPRVYNIYIPVLA